MLKRLFKNRRHPANVFILLVAVVIFGFLMGLSYSIAQLKMINLEQSSVQVTKTKLKLINDSGLNEVIATRLFPTSNRYSWQYDTIADIAPNSDPVTSPLPFLTDSSYVYETVATVKKSVGRYQYVILGSNSYYDYVYDDGAEKWVYTVSTAKMDSGEHLYNIANPIYVAVRCFVCFDNATDAIAYDAVSPDTAAPYAKCGAGQTLKERTTITQLDVSVTTPVVPNTPEQRDLNTQINIISSEQITANTPFTLPSYILNRDNTSTNQFNFEDWWTNSGIHYGARGNADPVGIRYTKLVSGTPTKIYVSWPGGTSYTLPSEAIIPSLEILFRSAIDERSLYSVMHVSGNKYTPVSTLHMGVDSIEHAGYKQQEFSGTVLSTDGGFGPGYFSQNIAFPSLSLLKISGDVPCANTNQIIFNQKGQLRDADGFRNTKAYTFQYTAPTC